MTKEIDNTFITSNNISIARQRLRQTSSFLMLVFWLLWYLMVATERVARLAINVFPPESNSSALIKDYTISTIETHSRGQFVQT